MASNPQEPVVAFDDDASDTNSVLDDTLRAAVERVVDAVRWLREQNSLEGTETSSVGPELVQDPRAEELETAFAFIRTCLTGDADENVTLTPVEIATALLNDESFVGAMADLTSYLGNHTPLSVAVFERFGDRAYAFLANYSDHVNVRHVMRFSSLLDGVAGGSCAALELLAALVLSEAEEVRCLG